MNPSNDNGLNFFVEAGGAIDRQPQHHCRDVDMNNNCACVTNGEQQPDGGDKLHQPEPVASLVGIDQLPASVLNRLTTTIPRRRRRRNAGGGGGAVVKHVVTIDKLISRINALSKVATATTTASNGVGPLNELKTSRVRGLAVRANKAG